MLNLQPLHHPSFLSPPLPPIASDCRLALGMCLDNNGQPISTGKETPVSFPMAGDFDFMCINTDKSLEPIIKPADII